MTACLFSRLLVLLLHRRQLPVDHSPAVPAYRLVDVEVLQQLIGLRFAETESVDNCGSLERKAVIDRFAVPVLDALQILCRGVHRHITGYRDAIISRILCGFQLMNRRTRPPA